MSAVQTICARCRVPLNHEPVGRFFCSNFCQQAAERAAATLKPCVRCGQGFCAKAGQSAAAFGRQQFCSVHCRSVQARGPARPTRPCEFCGVPFVLISRGPAAAEQRFCSTNCARRSREAVRRLEAARC